jgi:uncharacterized protein YndB with AHSA1/START domain
MTQSKGRKLKRITGVVCVAIALGTSTARGAGATGPVTVTRVTSPEKALRFEVTVPASVDDVWMAFTTKEGLATWLWRDIRLDLRAGGDWLALLPGSTAGGTIVSFTPKHRLEIAAMAPETFPTVRAQRTLATFEFEAVPPASTRVTLVQSGWKPGREWDEAYDYLATGNAELLTQLYQRFVSGPLNWPKAR